MNTSDALTIVTSALGKIPAATIVLGFANDKEARTVSISGNDMPYYYKTQVIGKETAQPGNLAGDLMGKQLVFIPIDHQTGRPIGKEIIVTGEIIEICPLTTLAELYSEKELAATD